MENLNRYKDEYLTALDVLRKRQRQDDTERFASTAASKKKSIVTSNSLQRNLLKIFEDDVIKLQGELKVGYNPLYVLTRKSLAAIRVLKSTTGSYLWLPGLNGPVANTLSGSPYVLAPSMPEEGNSALSLAFGDFRRGYMIVDRTGLTVIRDPFTFKKKSIIEFTMNRWNTGLVYLPEAIVLLKLKS